MNLEDFIENLEIENTILESGPDQVLRHYTTLPGLIGILNKQVIQSQAYPYFKNNEISVIRKTGDIENIEKITDDKNIIGYFEIKFHVLNDTVKNIKKIKINEPYIVYGKRIDTILDKYKLKNKETILKNPTIIKEKLSKEEYDLLLDLIHDLNLSLIKKEGEERISRSIPVDEKYLKFYFTKNLNTIKMSQKSRSTINYYKIMRPELFG